MALHNISMLRYQIAVYYLSLNALVKPKKINYMSRIITLPFLCISSLLYAQQPIKPDTTKREAIIQHSGDDNVIKFSALTPPLQQIQGAPQAFFTYYWEFGDGNYSTAPAPTHTYKKEGEHTVKLWTTNNYDNGKPPPSRPKKVVIKKITSIDTPPAPVIPEGFNLKNNREPVPDEEMVVIASYQNEFDYATNGKLYLFFNEKKFRSNNFELTEVRTHHGEKQVQDLTGVAHHVLSSDITSLVASANEDHLISSLSKDGPELGLNLELDKARDYYHDSYVLEFNDMAAHETRNLFYSFKTTPEMLKDTSARITIKGIYVPERGVDKHKSKSLEMEIVTSHDPNKMSVSDTRLNYRFYKNKDIDFKIRFQNNGEGPARSIKLNVDVPAMYDKQTLNVLDAYPPCPICPDEVVTYSCLDTLLLKDKIVFHFKNIYLPGSNQKNVSERDSTKGFVKYSLRFNKKISKENTASRTAIIFDKNEPIITNAAKTRFKPGISLGIKAGYNSFSSLTNSKNYFAGITLSPYRSQHGYLQAELMAGTHTYTDSTKRRSRQQFTDFVLIQDTLQQNDHKNFVLALVPVSYRYTINKFIGIGAGLQVNVDLVEKIKEQGVRKIGRAFQGQTLDPKSFETEPISGERENSFANLNTAVFGDVTVGSARIGPSVGVRYVFNFNSPHQQWQLYALWKF